jgi:hypothetical protein
MASNTPQPSIGNAPGQIPPGANGTYAGSLGGNGTSSGGAYVNGGTYDPSSGLLPEYSTGSPGAGVGTVPGLPTAPNYGGTLANQINQANQAYSNMGQQSNQLMGSYAQAARQQLPGQLRSVQDSYNSRGLLNSGQESQGEAGTIAGVNSNLANTQQQINAQLLNNLGTLQGNAFQTAQTSAQPGPQTANTYLQGVAGTLGAETQNQILANQGYGNLAGGIASVGGALAGTMQQNGNNPISTFPGYGNPMGQNSGYSPYTMTTNLPTQTLPASQQYPVF